MTVKAKVSITVSVKDVIPTPNDLPIYLRNAQASRHDGILAIFAMSEVRKLYPQFTIKAFPGDGSMDNYPTHELFYHWRITPFIPLDSNVKYPGDLPPGVLCLDDDANPICMGGIPYQKDGLNYPKGIKYICWFDYHGIVKPCHCTDSPYGRTVYLKPENDFRIFTPVPRGSDVCKEKLKPRTSLKDATKGSLRIMISRLVSVEAPDSVSLELP